MIPLVLITSNARVRKAFSAADRSRTFRLTIGSAAELFDSLMPVSEPTLCYVDLAEYENEPAKLLRKLREDDLLRVGIVDARGVVEDVAALFHHGAVDYLGPALLTSEASTKRLRAAFEYRPVVVKAAPRAASPKPAEWRVSGKSWRGIKSGNEYTFVLLYIEIDLTDEWKKESGREHLDEVMSAFHRHVKHVIAPLRGRVWMWTESGGVVLFPFDGVVCPPIEMCMKLIVDRTIISVEHYSYNTRITYRMALHIGNTFYQVRGNTGTLISDTVNFTFHLGQKFLAPGSFCITETVAPFLAEGLRDCFLPAGRFENVDVFRMKLPSTTVRRARS